MLTTKEIPLDSITLRDEFKRQASIVDKHSDFVLSIKLKGILYPLILMETQEGLTLVAGYRRYEAAKILGLPTVPCICLKVGIDDAEILRLHENLYREDISPVAEAEAMARLETTYHFTRAKIAQLLGKSGSYVTQRLQILQWHPKLRHALAIDEITYSVARELSAVTDTPSLLSMLHQVLTSGASVRTIATWVQDWKSSQANLPEGIKPSQLQAETRPKEGEPTSCYFCARYLAPETIKHISICHDCLARIDAADE